MVHPYLSLELLLNRKTNVTLSPRYKNNLGGRLLSRKKENTGFICLNCKAEVIALTNGSYRNHCPKCLYSKHVDIIPGDRKNNCLGLMKPVSIEYNSKKGYQLIHKCLKCRAVSKNIIAIDCEQEDEYIGFMKYKSKF